jgi:hypothetical protein
MDFEQIVTSLARQFAVIWQAPFPFLVCVFVAALVIWRLMEWRYGAIVEGLGHRLQLRDDAIQYLKRGHPEGPAPPPDPRIPQEQAIKEAPRPLDEQQAVVAPPKDRVFITNKTITELMAKLDNHTEIRESALARPYIGKWIEITLPVRNVIQRENETVVSLTRPDAWACQIWLHFPGDRDRLEILDVNDMLTAVGRITELHSVHARLDGCEMVRAT